MPTILPNLVPTKSPGTLFSALTGGDDTLNVRWLTPTDPVFYEAVNRPMADITLRQLVIAKAIDTLSVSVGREVLFPYLNQPTVSSGTTAVDVPIGLIWDMHASMPKKWENLRLAKIKRISGSNSGSYTGKLRLIFTANVQYSSTEVAIFYVDYQIDSSLTYQLLRLLVVPSTEEAVVINPGEEETVGGFIIFKTLDADLEEVQIFYNLVAPPSDTTDSNGDGIFDNPAVYEITDSIGGGTAVTDDFSLVALSHGTGLLLDSAWNAIPELNSDIQTWLTSLNYPFDAAANRTSVDGIVIPNGLFREFDITAPAGDQPTGDSSGLYFPVWVTRIEKIGTGSNQLRFYFATYNVTETETGGQPSTTPIEFASMDLLRTGVEGEIVEISPLTNLKLATGGDADLFQQHFGRGHVVLSSLWDGTSSTIADFFDAFDLIVDSPADTTFSQTSTRIGSFGISRVPKYTPTVGQSRALAGSTARRSPAISPSDDNRYVCELDQGQGTQVDLEAQTGITPQVAIDRYGYKGSLCHITIKLIIDATQLGNSPDYYDTQILPRLRILLGRDPQFGDWWYDGTRLKFFNGDSWQSSG